MLSIAARANIAYAAYCSISQNITTAYYSKFQYGIPSIPITSLQLMVVRGFKLQTIVQRQSLWKNKHLMSINLPDLVRNPSGFPRFSFTVWGRARSPEQHFLPCHTLSWSMYLKTMSLASAFSQRLHLTCFLLFSYMFALLDLMIVFGAMVSSCFLGSCSALASSQEKRSSFFFPMACVN